MKKIVLLCFVLLGLVAAQQGSAQPATPLSLDSNIDRPSPWEMERIAPSPSPDFYRHISKSVVEIRGVLDTRSLLAAHRYPIDYLHYLLNGGNGSIRVDNKVYTLDFGADPDLHAQARRLHGKRVRISGTVARRELPRLMPASSSQVPSQTAEIIVVTDIEDLNEYVRETVDVDIQGRFHLDMLLGFDGTMGPVVLVQAKTFVLDFSNLGQDWHRFVQHFDGKSVRLKGRLCKMQSYIGPMIPETQPVQYRLLHVSSFEAAEQTYVRHGDLMEISGKLRYYRHIRFGRGAVDIEAAGKAYWLDFGGNDALYKKAAEATSAGHTVLVKGGLRKSDQAVVVHDVEVVRPPEHYRETVTVEICGFLQQAERWGGVMELCIYPPNRTLQVNVNGKVYTLQFSDRARYVDAYERVGTTVVVFGTLERQTLHVSDMVSALPPVCLRPVPDTLS
ncbi:MAG: alkaline shock response membrane anchor protein AmaP [Gemmataceae bacterium]|nr:alkaline shock response membrane anchor protein AmaP [Gemmataceae bacterium]